MARRKHAVDSTSPATASSVDDVVITAEDDASVDQPEPEPADAAPGYDTGDPGLDAQLADMDANPIGGEFGSPEFLAAEAEAIEQARVAAEARAAEAHAARAAAMDRYLADFEHHLRQLTVGDAPAPLAHATLMQGIAIAATEARERRSRYPACTPEASVAAVEALPAAITRLRHLLECYANLARAAANGADIATALTFVDEIAAPIAQ